MARFSLTICGLSVLLGLPALGQQSTAPQISTGVGSRPRYQTQVVPRSPSANVARPPAPRSAAARAAARQRPAAGTPVNPHPGVVAPKKDPVASGTPGSSASAEPMGPPYPAPEIPKPARPADMPPAPPQVTYRDGMLTVHALNSTMSSVLQAIRSKTGIEFEGAGNSSERVAVNMGPAPEGDVLASIFSGSSFDYVVLGRADSPGIVQRVILTPRAKGGAAVAGGPPQPLRQQQPGAEAQQQADEDTNDEAVQADEDPQDAPNQAPQVQEPPAAQNEPQQPQQNEAQQNENQPNAPKTPEQLLQELKQMQLQQQQQQGQPPPDTNSVPRKAPPR